MLDDLAGLSKLLELGALGLINFVLIFKGIGRMQELTDSVKDLAETVSNLKISNENIERRLTALEEFVRNELRDIKFKLEYKRGDYNERQ